MNAFPAASFTADIPLSLAISAHSGTSFVPQERGASEQASYAAELEEVYSALRAAAKKGGTLARLEEEFARFRGGYGARYRKWLSSRSRVMSWMIAGPSNFPARRNAKRNACADRRLEDLLDFKARALIAAVRNLRPDLRPIMAGDADALERLETKIRRAELLQARMKAANAAIRKYAKQGREAQLRALVEQGFSDKQAERLTIADPFHGKGFPQFELTNNNANIRRMKQRIEQIRRAHATPDSSREGANGVQMDDCPSENRVRLTFPGKPSAEIRAALKSNGFRWAPSLGVWQAYRNYRSLEHARSVCAG